MRNRKIYDIIVKSIIIFGNMANGRKSGEDANICSNRLLETT